jgi:hypothetical protein
MARPIYPRKEVHGEKLPNPEEARWPRMVLKRNFLEEFCLLGYYTA